LLTAFGVVADVVRLLPNAITLARAFLGPACAWALIGHGANRVAFWLFLLAICTDLVDGWVARKLGAISETGKWLDGLSDKVLTDVIWVALASIGFAPWWLAIGILARDLGVILAWIWALWAGKRWEASPTGQVMVAFEGTALCVLLFHGPWIDVHWPTVGTAIGTISLVLSVVSVIGYIRTGPMSVSDPRWTTT
jgi:CDP-diacylglycerol---glycerol-3-phosphate 3-phosphatidyltransferase